MRKAATLIDSNRRFPAATSASARPNPGAWPAFWV
jgi:hypothetical protein